MRSNPPTLPPPHESCEVVTLCSILVLLPPRRRAPPVLFPFSSLSLPPRRSFPSSSHSCCYLVPVWPDSVCFLPCVRRGNATQREQARATVIYSKRPRKRSPHFLHVPLVFNRLVHLASPSLRCVTRYVTNGRFPPPPPHHYRARVFFVRNFAKMQKIKK